ncbi:WAP-type 'four-disulfide core [Trichuris suis]|nr:WAP-type 'four-disulfide core [Trichuris suis]
MAAQWFHVLFATLAILNLPAAEGRKTGSCPKLLVEIADDAIDRCDRDENCEGRRICCPTVKGRICMAPIDVRAMGKLLTRANISHFKHITKTGNELCPPYVGSRKSDAIDRCQRDSDCPQGRYCCDSIAGYVCMKPEPAVQASILNTLALKVP